MDEELRQRTGEGHFATSGRGQPCPTILQDPALGKERADGVAIATVGIGAEHPSAGSKPRNDKQDPSRRARGFSHEGLLCVRRDRSRQGELKYCAARRIPISGPRATPNGPADPQSQARAMTLGGKEQQAGASAAVWNRDRDSQCLHHSHTKIIGINACRFMLPLEIFSHALQDNIGAVNTSVGISCNTFRSVRCNTRRRWDRDESS